MYMITLDDAKAFHQTFFIPPKNQGVLNGLTFAIKDTIDIQGYHNFNGHPEWKKTHLAAASNAFCIEQLLYAGATCIGQTTSVELTFSIEGENLYFGTPLNPKAPDRVPGGSSSGSASAVACGFADFALGTDNTGSIRVPASHCGIWGIRPSPQAISVAGVIPFAPSFDNLGVLASNADILVKTTATLIGRDIPKKSEFNHIYLIKEAFALSDQEVRDAIGPFIENLYDCFPNKVKEISLQEIFLNPFASSLIAWSTDIIQYIQWPEIINSLGSWLEFVKPKLSPRIQQNVHNAYHINHAELEPALKKLKQYKAVLNHFLKPLDLICIPTTPTIAPLISQLSDQDFMNDYYERTFGLNAIAVIGGLPQVTLPIAMARQAPVGLSFLAKNSEDPFLLSILPKLNFKAA